MIGWKNTDIQSSGELASLSSTDSHTGFLRVKISRWRSHLWSTRLSDPSVIRRLGILLNNALQGDHQVGSILMLPGEECDAPSYNPPVTPERVAASTGGCLFSEASRFVLLLFTEGHLEYAQSIIGAIVSGIPCRASHGVRVVGNWHTALHSGNMPGLRLVKDLQ